MPSSQVKSMNLHDLVRSSKTDYKTQFYVLVGISNSCLKKEQIKNKGGKVLVNREVTDFSFSSESKLFTVNLALDRICLSLNYSNS